MINLIACILLGFILRSILQCFINWVTNKKKYERNCKNCKHSTPYEGKDNELHFYCGLAIQKDVSTFPVSSYNCCGHFDYTEELKTEQMRDNAEKLIRKENVQIKRTNKTGD